jgi:polyphosphate glucokinase
MKVLVIDVGGTNVKFAQLSRASLEGVEVQRVLSGPELTAKQMAASVLQVAKDWNYEVVSIGYPGPILRGEILTEPKNLGPEWVGFDFAKAFGKPVRLINDAAMQALGSYDGGCMLFLGLGTGLGSALIIDNVVAPMELAHLPYRKKRTFEDYVGERGRKRLGSRCWRRAVWDVMARLKAALVVDYVVLGGGNAKRLTELPEGARLGSNKNALVGGYRLWEPTTAMRKTGSVSTPPRLRRRRKRRSR